MTSLLFVYLGFLQIGTSELLFLVFVTLMLFGGKKLPELARGLGRGIREFKDASESIKQEISNQINSVERDLEVENPIISDEEIERQRNASKAKLEEEQKSIENTGESSESGEPAEQKAVEQSVVNSPETTSYKDPRLKAIFTAPEGAVRHNSGREPDYKSTTEEESQS